MKRIREMKILSTKLQPIRSYNGDSVDGAEAGNGMSPTHKPFTYIISDPESVGSVFTSLNYDASGSDFTDMP